MTVPAGFSNGVMCANNVCFDGTRTAQMTATDQIIVGKTGFPPEILTLTAGSGLSITHGAGILTLAYTGVLLTGYTDAAPDYNTALGVLSNVSVGGTYNTAIGYNCLTKGVGDYNTAIGAHVMNRALGVTGSYNVGIGWSVFRTNLAAGSYNVGLGYSVMNLLFSGSNNVGIGYYSLGLLTTGDNNVCIGYRAGDHYSSLETNNICIGANVEGVGLENNVIRLGVNGTHAACYIGGISGVTPTVAGAKVPIIDSNGQLGTLAAMTNGQLVIGSTGANPQLGTLSDGTGILISEGAGSITINAVGGGISWSAVSAGVNFVNNRGFIVIAPGGNEVFTLPANSSVGDVIGITLDGATSFGIAQGATQTVRIGSVVTTAGAGTKVVSTARGDTLLLLCTVAGTGVGDGAWNAISVIGNFTMT